MESKSRPNLGKYGYKASIYEKSEISMNKTIIDTDFSRDMMVASTKSQEENFCKSSKIVSQIFANNTFSVFSLVPSQPAGQDGYDEQYPEVGRSPSFMIPKERIA